MEWKTVHDFCSVRDHINCIRKLIINFLIMIENTVSVCQPLVAYKVINFNFIYDEYCTRNLRNISHDIL